MTDFLATLTHKDVHDRTSFAEYCQQKIGTPYPRNKDWGPLGKRANEFFELNPAATWDTLCKVADWCKARKRRPAHAYAVIPLFRYAWSDGWLPELDPHQRDEDTELEIQQALEQETNDEWRSLLIRAHSNEARKVVLTSWRKKQS